MERFFLGIDNGGTVIKAAVFDENGRQIGAAQRSTPVEVPYPGWAQRDMEQMWQVNCQVIRDALTASGISGDVICGVGCTGHGKGLYLWGKDGKPAYPGIASTDNRAQGIVEEIEAAGIAEQLRQLTLQSLLACQPAALLLWLKRQQPQAYENIAWVFEAKDYIRFRLTGEAFAEVTDYSGTSLMNLHTASFDPRILQLLGLEELQNCLPPLRYSSDFCGGVSEAAAQETGLRPGTPVCGGMFDIDAAAVAMGVTDPAGVAVVTGTWSINEYVSPNPVTACPTTKNSLFCQQGFYLVEESSATSAGNLEWFIDTLMREERDREKAEGRSIYPLVDSIVARTPMSDVLFAPYLYGSNHEGQAGAFFSGLSMATSKEDMLRAVFEGVVFSHALHLERLLAQREPPAAVRMCGGAANSEVWVQMFADVIGLPVETIAAREPGALGCAMAAAIAAGCYGSYAEAVQHMTHVKKVCVPDPAKYEAYQKKFGAFKEQIERLAK
ncbi:MAG TPA: carbohydrate kinase [Candidatus Gallacutalibacter stercoravium]|nr:carbohydrate kinase [Candidatus Gallacutalibacter stercoravium]